MRRAVFALAIVLIFAPALYVQRGIPTRANATIVALGSRDRHLRGKHRIRARRAA